MTPTVVIFHGRNILVLSGYQSKTWQTCILQHITEQVSGVLDFHQVLLSKVLYED